MPEFRVAISNTDTGVTVATTYMSAESKGSLCDALIDLATDAENGDDDWLDGAFEDEAE